MNDAKELISCCWDSFEEMKKFYQQHRESCTGFNFSYSPKKSWDAMPSVLLLTYHPAPHKNESPANPQPAPPSPWPGDNELFKPDLWPNSLFPVRLLTMAAEIALRKEGIDYTASVDNEPLEKFVNHNMVVASFVPFRTTEPNKEDIHFSKEQYWGKILQFWQPKVILAAGDKPFAFVQDVLKGLGFAVPQEQCISVNTFPSDAIHGPCTRDYKYRVCRCTGQHRHTIHLLGVPSPSAPGFCGYPRRSRPFPKGPAPIQEFLKTELEHIDI